MRIAQIVGSVESEASGPSYTVPSLARGLAGLGHDVDLLSLGGPSDSARDGFRDKRFSASPLALGPLAKLGHSAGLQRSIEQGEYDILHTHGLWMMPNVYPASVAGRTKAPFLLSPRGMLGEGALSFSSTQKRIFWNLAQGRAAKAVRCFHATSEQELDDIRNYGLSQPVAVIPNGVDVPAMADRRDEGAPKASSQARIVLSLGRIHPKKGLDRLVQAWSQVPAAQRAGWRLVLVGPDQLCHSAELAAQARALGLSDVEISGPVFGEEKRDLMRRAALFVLPTLSENFAMTVAESLAVSTPVISTVGAPWSGLVTQGCGWWVDHGPDPMAQALREAMALEPTVLQAMGAKGRDWMLSDFSWSSIASDMEQMYAWLLGKADRPDCVIG